MLSTPLKRIKPGLDTDNQARGVIRKQDEVIIVNDDDNNVVPGVFMEEDLVDLFSISGEENFPGQEMGNPFKINEISDKRDSLHCGKRKRQS